MVKAISLLSGGLDSILATKLILEQAIPVEGLYFLTAFFSDSKLNSQLPKKAAEKLGISLKIIDISKDFLKVVKNPKYGYGSQMNPCIDCRIFMLKKAKEYMKKTGASFLITGEVLGERPMSQRKDTIKLIEKESNLEGLILRPLSAKLLEPTIPEKKGLVDREKLLQISGRSRIPQIQLARQFGIKDHPNPSGGCLLTDPCFSKRIKDLLKYKPNFSLNDVQLLKVGRHFRVSRDAKLIVGRNQQENEKLMDLAKKGDYLFYPKTLKGPIAIGRGKFTKELFVLCAKIVAHYSDYFEDNIEIVYKKVLSSSYKSLFVSPIFSEELQNFRINF